MSNLSSVFDVLRGWPNGSALTYDFKQSTNAVSDIEEGTVVSIEAASSPTAVDRHTSALIGPNDNLPDHPWLVIRGKESSESEFSGNLTCAKLRTGIVFKVPTLLTPAVGDNVWANAGVLTNVDPAGGEFPLGQVIEFNATDGWMVVES